VYHHLDTSPPVNLMRGNDLGDDRRDDVSGHSVLRSLPNDWTLQLLSDVDDFDDDVK